MTITAQDLLTELGTRAWSGFNLDDMLFNEEDSAQARTELNAAVRYLINLVDFPFRAKKKNLLVLGGINQYTLPAGKISEIYNSDTLKPLEFIGSADDLEEQTGEPTSYYVSYKNPKGYINLYPTPDTNYNMTVVYNQFYPVMAQDKTLKFEFTEATDIINMPANLEYLFKDCLLLMTMIQNNKDEQDENYRPTIDEFEKRWRLFKDACNPVDTITRYVWNQV